MYVSQNEQFVQNSTVNSSTHWLKHGPMTQLRNAVIDIIDAEMTIDIVDVNETRSESNDDLDNTKPQSAQKKSSQIVEKLRAKKS